MSNTLEERIEHIANSIGSPWGEGATYDRERVKRSIELGEQPSSHLDDSDKADFKEDIMSLILSEADRIGMEAISEDFEISQDDKANTKIRLRWINVEKDRERQRLSKITGIEGSKEQ